MNNPHFISLRVQNSLTKTPGSPNSNWDISYKIWKIQLPPNFQWMTSMKNYLSYYENWEKRWKSRLKNKLDRLKIYLYKNYWFNIDPIKFLIFLYYYELLSVEEIHKRICEMWFNYRDSNWLLIAFKSTFWWELREKSWSSISSRKRKTNWQIDKAKLITDNKNKKKYETLTEYINKKVSNILWNEFDFNLYESLKNKTEKILYLIWLFLWINENDIKNFYEKLKIWTRVISNYLNTELSNFLDKPKLNIILNPITPVDITRIIEKAS